MGTRALGAYIIPRCGEARQRKRCGWAPPVKARAFNQLEVAVTGGSTYSMSSIANSIDAERKAAGLGGPQRTGDADAAQLADIVAARCSGGYDTTY